MKRLLIILMGLIMLVACEPKTTIFNLEKDGVLYNYNDVITFYYPRDWNVTKDELKLSLDIINQNQREALYFDTFEADSGNSTSDLMILYEAKLKDLGVEIIEESEVALESGQSCFYLEGHIERRELSFCEVVVFVGTKQYIYSYIADENVYNENCEIMKNYLYSLAVNEAMKTTM